MVPVVAAVVVVWRRHFCRALKSGGSNRAEGRRGPGEEKEGISH